MMLCGICPAISLVYQVEYATNLLQPVWEDVGGAILSLFN